MAKLILLSDLHLRDTIPQGRIDNFQDTMWSKLEFVFRIAEDEKVDAILQAGDFFDKAKPSYGLVTRFIATHQFFNSTPIYCVIGQHDMYMRSSNIADTAFGLLATMEILFIAQKFPVGIKDCMIYGNSYGDTYDFEVETKYNAINILITHDMIGNKPLYPGHEYTDAGKFLADHPEFDIILCGDYHYPFHIRRDGRHIVNTGCMLRMTRDDRDMNRKPFFYIVDTTKNEWKQYEIPHEPVNMVFADKKDVPELAITNEGDLLRFIQQLKQKGKSGIHYLDVLDEYCREHEISNEVQDLIKEVLI